MYRPMAATVLGAIGVVAVGLAWVGFVLTPGASELVTWAMFSAIALLTIAMGVLVAWRVRRNIVGILLVVAGVLEAALVARAAWYWVAFVHPGLLPRPGAHVLAFDNGLGALCFVAVTFVIAWFPSGRLATSAWRLLISAVGAASILLVVGSAFSGYRNLPPYEDVPPLVTQPSTLQRGSALLSAGVFVAVLSVAIVLAMLRVRRATGVERAQLRWVLLGACLFLFFPLVCGGETRVEAELPCGS